MEHDHTQAALSYTATNAQWQLVVHKFLVEVEVETLFLAFELQLAHKRLLVDTDSHRRKLKGSSEDRIPDKNVAIEACLAVLCHCSPVVVVGGAAVVFLAVAEFSAYTYYEHCTVFAANLVFALLWSLVGIHL